MAFSSMRMERMGEGESTSGLNQRLGVAMFNGGVEPGRAVEKPEVLAFGLCAIPGSCFFACSHPIKETQLE